jgi:hypothetical protein
MHPPSPSAATYTIYDFAENREVKISKADMRQRFEHDGVVVMPGFLAEAQMLPLRRELDAHYAPLASKACDLAQWSGHSRPLRVRRDGVGAFE